MEELALACLQLVAMFAATCAVGISVLQCTSVYFSVHESMYHLQGKAW